MTKRVVLYLQRWWITVEARDGEFRLTLRDLSGWSPSTGWLPASRKAEIHDFLAVLIERAGRA